MSHYPHSNASFRIALRISATASRPLLAAATSFSFFAFAESNRATTSRWMV